MAEEERNYNTEDGFIVKIGDDDDDDSQTWDGELRGLMLGAGRSYAKKFPDAEKLELEDLPPDQWEQAYNVLIEAVNDDVPLTQDEFNESLKD